MKILLILATLTTIPLISQAEKSQPSSYTLSCTEYTDGSLQCFKQLGQITITTNTTAVAGGTQAKIKEASIINKYKTEVLFGSLFIIFISLGMLFKSFEDKSTGFLDL